MRDVPLEVEAIQREFPFLKEAEPLTSAPPPVLPIQSSMLGENSPRAVHHQRRPLLPPPLVVATVTAFAAVAAVAAVTAFAAIAANPTFVLHEIPESVCFSVIQCV